MCKKVDLEVVASYPDGTMSYGTIHELDESQVLEVAFGVIHALVQYTEGFVYSTTSKEKDTHTIILHISEDTGKERKEMDEIVESSMVVVEALSTMP